MTQTPAPEATAMLRALLGPFAPARARAYFDDVEPEPGTVALWAEVEWYAWGPTATVRQPVATRQRWALAMGGDVTAAVRLMTEAVDRLRAAGLACTCRGVGTCPVHHITTTVPMREGVIDLSTGTLSVKPLTSPYPGEHGTTVHPPGSPLVKSLTGVMGIHEGTTIVEDPSCDPNCPVVVNMGSWKIESLGDAPTIVNDDGLTHVRTEERVPMVGPEICADRSKLAHMSIGALAPMRRLGRVCKATKFWTHQIVLADPSDAVNFRVGQSIALAPKGGINADYHHVRDGYVEVLGIDATAGVLTLRRPIASVVSAACDDDDIYDAEEAEAWVRYDLTKHLPPQAKAAPRQGHDVGSGLDAEAQLAADIRHAIDLLDGVWGGCDSCAHGDESRVALEAHLSAMLAKAKGENG